MLMIGSQNVKRNVLLRIVLAVFRGQYNLNVFNSIQFYLYSAKTLKLFTEPRA